MLLLFAKSTQSKWIWYILVLVVLKSTRILFKSLKIVIMNVLKWKTGLVSIKISYLRWKYFSHCTIWMASYSAGVYCHLGSCFLSDGGVWQCKWNFCTIVIPLLIPVSVARDGYFTWEERYNSASVLRNDNDDDDDSD